MQEIRIANGASAGAERADELVATPDDVDIRIPALEEAPAPLTPARAAAGAAFAAASPVLCAAASSLTPARGGRDVEPPRTPQRGGDSEASCSSDADSGNPPASALRMRLRADVAFTPAARSPAAPARSSANGGSGGKRARRADAEPRTPAQPARPVFLRGVPNTTAKYSEDRPVGAHNNGTPFEQRIDRKLARAAGAGTTSKQIS